jgi:glutathione S-transferase
LADNAGSLIPTQVSDRYEPLQWLMFPDGRRRPMMGQASHFQRALEPQLRQDFAIARNGDESRRLLEVLDRRDWERLADTHLDAILTVIGNWKFAELPPMPRGLFEAARRDASTVYDRLQAQLSSRDYICGEVGTADFAFYPQVASGAALNVPLDRDRHTAVVAWLKRMRSRPEGQTDLASAQRSHRLVCGAGSAGQGAVVCGTTK